MALDDAWRAHAACAGLPADLFFPPPEDLASVDLALAVCARCTVRTHCLTANVTEGRGIWGGTTEDERRSLRRIIRMNTKLRKAVA